MFCTNEATKKLFKAIQDENLEDFKQALAEGANVNAFDEVGMTPLMSIANIYTASSNHPQLQEMVKLLVQHKNIDINIKSKEAVVERRPKEHEGYPVYEFEGREIVDRSPSLYCIYLDNSELVDTRFSPHPYDRVEEEIKTGKKKKNTALHIACQMGSIDMVRILFIHPDIKINIKNYENKSPKDCIAEHVKEVIESEFLKVEKRNQLSESATQKSHCAYAFLLSGVLAAGLCFIVDNPVPPVAAALLFFAIGCGFLDRANTVLNDANVANILSVSVQVRCYESR